MMEINDINIYSRSDSYYSELIGEYVRKARISQDRTQQEIADAAGVNRATLGQLENGKPVNMLSLIQVLRALKRLDLLLAFESKPQVSPLQLAALEQKQRIRAGRRREREAPESDW